MSIADQINGYVQKVEQMQRMKTAIGRALTPEQQLAVSAKIKDGPDQFIAWLGTPEGTAAARSMAEAFAGTTPAATSPASPADTLKGNKNDAT